MRHSPKTPKNRIAKAILFFRNDSLVGPLLPEGFPSCSGITTRQVIFNDFFPAMFPTDNLVHKIVFTHKWAPENLFSTKAVDCALPEWICPRIIKEELFIFILGDFL